VITLDDITRRLADDFTLSPVGSYRDVITLRELERYYWRRRDRFGVPPPTRSDLVQRLGLRTRNALAEHWNRTAPFLGMLK
jgi:hypothetical protein